MPRIVAIVGTKLTDDGSRSWPYGGWQSDVLQPAPGLDEVKRELQQRHVMQILVDEAPFLTERGLETVRMLHVDIFSRTFYPSLCYTEVDHHTHVDDPCSAHRSDTHLAAHAPAPCPIRTCAR